MQTLSGRSIGSAVFVLCLFLSAASNAKPLTMAQFTKKPKLVVTIVIDQCRSDFLTRFEKRMRSQKGGGLSYLMKNGAYFPFAKYDIMQSMTCPGHATVLTGSYPYQMGIPLNEWYDAVKKTDVYCAEDITSPIVGRDAKPEEGMSPRRLVGSTVGDELKIAGYKSKVVTIALKDRSAIMMGGHRADLAMWVESGKWVSSKYYLPEGKLPAWILELNAGLEKEKGTKFSWKIAGEATGLTESVQTVKPTSAVNAPDGVADEPSVAKGIDRSRETIAGSTQSFATQYGVKVTTQAAIRALKEFKLGLGPTPDILAVSYSSHDMLGHEKGLQSSLMEELTMSEDESIGELLKAIDQQVGLKNVVFAFTGDHGVAPPATLMKAAKMPAGAIDVKALLGELNSSLDEKWGKSSKGPWILRLKSLNLYLDPAVMADKKKDRIEVENEVKRLILKPRANGEPEREGIAQVFTRTDWENRKLPTGRWERQILKTFIPGKSGDVVLILKSFWVDSNAFATHLSGYNYDRSVPLIIAGGNAHPGVYANEVEVVDLAPTLSFMLGLVAPSGSDGRVLHEIFSP
ncbi:alkaline phosphatase family protein [soil metagenome]